MKKLFDLQSITSEKILRALIIKMIAAFFMLGLVIDTLIFPHRTNWLVFWLYVVSDLSLLLIYTCRNFSVYIRI